MTRALIWKEWREQRAVALAGLAMGVGLPLLVVVFGRVSPTATVLNVADVMNVLVPVLIWPFAAAAAGASVNLMEGSNATLGFLLSRPVPRRLLWTVKVGAGLVTAAVIVVGSLLAASGSLIGFYGSEARRHLRLATTLGSDESMFSLPLLLVFACSVFFATILRRTLTAAGAGIVMAVVLSGAILFAGQEAALTSTEDVGVTLGFAVVVLLAASAWIHTHGELLSGQAIRAHASRALMVGFSVFIAGSGTLAWAMTRVTLANVRFDVARFSREAGVVALDANRTNRASPQIWTLDLEGQLRRLTARHTYDPIVSPSGQWIAYLSNRGPFGVPRRTSWGYGYPRYEMRLVRPDGSDDHLFLSASRLQEPSRENWWRPDAWFSPTGERLAVGIDGGVFLVASVTGGEPLRVDVSGEVPDWDVAWTADGDSLILDSGLRGRSVVGIYDVPSRSLRTIEIPESWFERFIVPGPGPYRRWVPVRGARRKSFGESTGWRKDRYGIALVDLETGEARLVVEESCGWLGAVAMHDSWLAYTTCDGGDEGRALVEELHVLDLEPHVDEVVVRFEARIRSLQFGPDGTRMLVHVAATGSVSERTSVVGRDGMVRDVGAGWRPVGWVDDGRVMLERLTEAPDALRFRSRLARLVIADVDSGEMTTIYATPEN